MRAVPARDADDLEWTVAVQWRPRPLGLVRRFGGWRDKRRDPHQGEDAVANAVDAATSPYPGWDYSPARHGVSGDVGSGGHGGGSVDLPGGHGGGGGGGWDLGGLDEGFAVVVAVVLALVAVIVAAAAFWWVVLPLLTVVVDAAVVVILFVAGFVARVVFRRPWTVQATSSRGDRLTRKVVGWRHALRQRDEMVSALRNGALRVARTP
jgi:hypothetical protein